MFSIRNHVTVVETQTYFTILQQLNLRALRSNTVQHGWSVLVMAIWSTGKGGDMASPTAS